MVPRQQKKLHRRRTCQTCHGKDCGACMKPYAKEVDSIKARQVKFARMMCPWVNFLQTKIKKATLTRPHWCNWSRIMTGSLRCNCSYLFNPVSSIDTALITLTSMFITTFVIIADITDSITATCRRIWSACWARKTSSRRPKPVRRARLVVAL